MGILSSLLLLKRNQKPKMLKDIPYFFNGPAPYIFAHRGGMSVRPEQTQLAFDNAVDYGLDGFETDVRLFFTMLQSTVLLMVQEKYVITH